MTQKVEFKFSIAHLACRCASASGTFRVMGHVVVPGESAAATPGALGPPPSCRLAAGRHGPSAFCGPFPGRVQVARCGSRLRFGSALRLARFQPEGPAYQ